MPNGRRLLLVSFPYPKFMYNFAYYILIGTFNSFYGFIIIIYCRCISADRAKFGRNPTSNDLEEVKQLYNTLLAENNLTDPTLHTQAAFREGLLTTDTDFLTICQSIHPTISYGLITTVSVLGSVLTQEIIKGISLTGIPGFNVFLFDGATYSVKAIPVKEATDK